MIILPNIRKKMIVSMTALVMSLLMLFIFQTGITFYTQAAVLNKLGERREKISLSSQVLTFAEKAISNPDKTKNTLYQLEKINTKLLDLVHTTEGKKTVQNMTIAIGNVRHGGDVRELIEAAKAINEFQNRRLGEEITILENEIKARGLWAVVISIIITIALGIFVVWGINKLGREYLLTKVVMQATSNGIIVGNEKGRISVLNNTFCFLLGGCKRSDMIGRPLAEAGEPGRVLALAIQENKYEKGKEMIIKDPNDNEVCLLVDTIPWKDDQDKVLGGMAVVRDNTVQWMERKKVNLENQDLREKADRDAMTGLYNYRAFINHIESTVSLNKGSFSLIMMDIDYFKTFNDTLGHLEGDRLLKELADILTLAVREEDIVARYGGDEFVIILKDTHLDRAHDVGERIRVNIANHPFDGRECLPCRRVTVSMGVAVFPEHGQTVEELIRSADNALYKAKKSSRNKIEFSQSSPLVS